MGNRCPYPDFYAQAATTPETETESSESPVLLMDCQGTCIFHSQDVDWKRKNGFGREFRQLIQLLNAAKQQHDFAEFVFVGDEVRMKKGSEKQVLRIADTIFLEEAIFTGASFLDTVEFDGIAFKQGGTFRNSQFLQDLKISNARCYSLDFRGSEFKGLAFFMKIECVIPSYRVKFWT